MIELIKGNSLELLDEMISNGIKVDAIITDPPYGSTNAKWDVKLNWKEFIDKCFKVIKDDGKLIMFGDYKYSHLLHHKHFRHKVYWIKQKGSDFLNSKVKPLNAVEEISVYYKKKGTYNPQKVKGKPYVANRNSNTTNLYNDYKAVSTVNTGERYPLNWIDIPNDKNTHHPTQKPVPLMEWIIKSYTNENDLVFDPFMGSGSTGLACKNINRKFMGVELDDKYFKAAEERINETI